MLDKQGDRVCESMEGMTEQQQKETVEFWSFVGWLFSDLIKWVQQMFEQVLDYIKKGLKLVKDTVAKVFRTVKDFLKDIFN